ncbi:MAG: HAMP domain-containing sensor histidine kinase [Bacteroidia bacterium]|nr:HAMP domain-containing sensor histidine kinase [Bacteroidia bacterium]
MLASIKSRDYSLHFNEQKLRGEELKLAQEINDVITELRDANRRIDAQYGYLEALLNKTKTFLIVVDDFGNVNWMNESAINGLCGFKVDRLADLAVLNDILPKELESLQVGQQKLVTMMLKGSLVEWCISMTRYNRQGVDVKLYSIDDVQSVLRQNEVEAQNKLVRVLTHEIMNSLSPIISLSDTLNQSFDEGNVDKEDVQMALQAIYRRSQGLLDFVESFRKVSRISQPQRAMVGLDVIISDLHQLFPSPTITFLIEDDTEMLYVDQSQIEHVLINLLKNAIEACEGVNEPKITLSTYANRPSNTFYIEISDNGQGISSEVAEQIFVPFFTTKNTGSGIGLSVCRQIINMHGGRISVESKEGEGAKFVVILPYTPPNM